MLYYRHFGKAMKEEVFNNLVSQIKEDAFGRGAGEEKIEFHDYYRFKISYITDREKNLMFLFVTGLNDGFDYIKKELNKCKKEFLNLFGDILDHKFDAKTFEVFDPTIDSIHRNLKPKISLCGFSGVGKTTTTRLIKAEEIPMQHVPTITGDIATIKIGKLHFHLWDFAGQEQFSYLWTNFVKGSDAVLLITDSTIENVEKSKFFLELIKEQAEYAHTAIIANKQDLPEAMDPITIENMMGLKTYSMIANRAENRDKMIQIIADVLDMSSEVSPLLKPLLERDTLMEEAHNALEAGDFVKSVVLFERISDLCIDLGDDTLSKEFYEKAQKIKGMLAESGTEVPESIESLEEARGVDASEDSEDGEIQDAAEISEGVELSEGGENAQIPKETPKIKPLPGSELILNPEDFMVKAKPKRVVNVPEDAKDKLKTTSYGHVENPPEVKAPKREAVSPTSLFDSELTEPPKPVAPVKAEPIDKIEEPVVPDLQKPMVPSPATPFIPSESSAPEEGSPATAKLTALPEKPGSTTTKPPATPSIKASDQQQIADIEKSLMELKIKKANISKMSLDFEMKELTGEITTEEYEEKIQKLKIVEQKLDDQIAELEQYIK